MLKSVVGLSACLLGLASATPHNGTHHFTNSYSDVTEKAYPLNRPVSSAHTPLSFSTPSSPQILSVLWRDTNLCIAVAHSGTCRLIAGLCRSNLAQLHCRKLAPTFLEYYWLFLGEGRKKQIKYTKEARRAVTAYPPFCHRQHTIVP